MEEGMMRRVAPPKIMKDPGTKNWQYTLDFQ